VNSWAIMRQEDYRAPGVGDLLITRKISLVWAVRTNKPAGAESCARDLRENGS
jgi:hypothetical protein